MEKREKSNWIWLKDWKPQDKEEPLHVLFRKEIHITEEPTAGSVRISADSRYKLYINGVFVEAGPSKGDRQVWYVDEMNILPYMKQGTNIIAVEVLRYPMEHKKGNHGIFRTEYPGLYVRGEICDNAGDTYTIDACDQWKCKKNKYYHIVSESEIFAPLQIYENTKGDVENRGWMQPDYDDKFWPSAFEYPDMDQAVSPGNLIDRTIPYLYHEGRTFQNVMVVRQSKYHEEEWNNFLQGKKQISIPAHSKEIIEINAGEEMTGYLKLFVQGGKNANIEILQSEAYVQEQTFHELPVKQDRKDYIHGHLEGFTDRYQCAGYGTEKHPEKYEPFWFRTFRFIQLVIETNEEPLILAQFNYTEVGYPLKVQTDIKTSDKEMEQIWDMSERTLKRCMHETYEDCPFYEQLQYAMDSRSQILYTYSVSADDRLARKCMDDFKRSQRYDGLLNCSYPCYGANVIPGFSIYYIMMLYDHMMYFGDKNLLEEHMPTIERILYYFHINREPEGYVKKIGGLNGKARFWSFVDWTPEWNETTGVPDATLNGAITMESLLYIMGLQHAAEIERYLGRNESAAEHIKQACDVQRAIRKYCVGENGMVQDGPGVEKYSQHTQVFAILTDTIDQERAKKNLKETIVHQEQYAQCSVAMAFYLFRALQKCGLYDQSKGYWEIWKRMLKKNATTCIEDEVGERSDCHAWGALLLYELPSVILGVRPAKPGYQAVQIDPETSYLKYAQGQVITPKGLIKVKWDKKEKLRLEYEVPEAMEVIMRRKKIENNN